MTIPTEHQEQCAVVRFFDLTHKEHRGRLFAVPNGAWLAGNPRTRAALVSKAKREGVRNGVPDLFLPIARGGYHGLFIEMKRLKGGVTSAEQKSWHQYLNEQGFLCVVCKGADNAIQLLKEYMQ